MLPVFLSNSETEETALIETHIREQIDNGEPLQILEAGCGQCWELKLDSVRFILTGIDLDKAALDIRKKINKDLDVAILGDLRDVDLGDKKYEVIYNSFVLEHIQNANAVLVRFTRWLKPNGLLIIRIPDPDSVQGFLTRVSPHWVHIFYYRYVLGKENAGTPGFAPYKTYYDPVVSRVGIHKFCDVNNLTIKAELGNAYWKPGHGIMRSAILAFKRVVSALSLGKLAWQYTDLLYIIQLNGPSRAD